jgi:hypothetical protein
LREGYLPADGASTEIREPEQCLGRKTEVVISSERSESRNLAVVVAVLPVARPARRTGGAAKDACPKCGSSHRSEYWGKIVQKCPGLRPDGTPYIAIIRRRSWIAAKCGLTRGAGNRPTTDRRFQNQG